MDPVFICCKDEYDIFLDVHIFCTPNSQMVGYAQIKVLYSGNY